MKNSKKGREAPKEECKRIITADDFVQPHGFEKKFNEGIHLIIEHCLPERINGYYDRTADDVPLSKCGIFELISFAEWFEGTNKRLSLPQKVAAKMWIKEKSQDISRCKLCG